jgi:hypothetical protein
VAEREKVDDKFTSSLNTTQNYLDEYSENRTRLQRKDIDLNSQIEKKKLEQKNELDNLRKTREMIITGLKEQIDKAKTEKSSNENEFQEKHRIETEFAELSEALEAEIADMKERLANKEKEKVIETHQLNQNISTKIEETRLALQDLKREQLDTTRR